MSRLIDVQDLGVHFNTSHSIFEKEQTLRAVDGINFHIDKKEILGLVGESGCGKTTTGKALLRIHEPTTGTITYDNTDITHLSYKEMLPYRKKMSIIYQDPYGSLNPRMSIGESIAEPMVVHKTATSSRALEDYTIELLRKVGIRPDYRHRYPHEFSGGQRQRIGIARALSAKPEFIIGDECVSALDVSIQAQIINLLMDLKNEMGLTMLFISHDLSVIKHICDRVALMYLGEIVEIAPKKEFFLNPKHPYGEALLSTIPVPDPTKKRKKTILVGDVPSPLTPPKGCRFHTRCPKIFDKCREVSPKLKKVDNNHFTACHLYS